MTTMTSCSIVDYPRNKSSQLRVNANRLDEDRVNDGWDVENYNPIGIESQITNLTL